MPDPKELINLLLNRGPSIEPGKLPPTPASLLPDPLASDTGLAKLVREITNIAPELRRNAKFVSHGPSANLQPTVERLNKPDRPVVLTDLLNSSIMGHTGKDGQIFVNPRWNEDAQTLGHEMSHVAGHTEASGVPTKMEQLMLELQKRKQ